MKRLALATVIFVGAALAATPALAQGNSQKTTNAASVPVAGSGGGGTFAGTLQLQQFAVSQGQVVANGLLSGVLTAANGTTTSVLQTVSLPVAVGTSSCQVLHLDLGPLSLTLLGLQVSLNHIVLDITAQPGAGNLLGNLLCSVANLLDNPASLVSTLNQILTGIA
jgi:hypothetical protein